MELLKKIREGELALLNNGTRAQLQEACMIVWPHVPPPNYSDSKFYHKAIAANTWDTTDWTVGAEISVTDFLKEYREWEEKKSPITQIGQLPKPEDIHVGGPGSIYNPEPEIDYQQAFQDALELLKRAASNMGKTVKVELRDKIKFRIQHI